MRVLRKMLLFVPAVAVFITQSIRRLNRNGDKPPPCRNSAQQGSCLITPIFADLTCGVGMHVFDDINDRVEGALSIVKGLS